MKKGTFIKVKTITKNDVFGTCIYEITETDMPCPYCKGQDGLRAVMLGGTGPSARAGLVIGDCEKKIQQDIAKGITQQIPANQAQAMKSFYESASAGRPGSGGIEVG